MAETLIIKDYTNEILEFKTISICIIYKNFLMTLVSVIYTLIEPLDYAYTPLFFCIANCYYHCMCFGEVLPPSPSHCKWQVDGPSRCCTPSLPCTSQFTFSSVIVSLLHCWCCYKLVVLFMPWWGITPPIALCMWWSSFVIGNKRKKLIFPLLFFPFVCLINFLFFSKRLFFGLFNNNFFFLHEFLKESNININIFYLFTKRR